MMTILIRLLGSKIGLIGIALSVALSWHYIDKAGAVRSAERELADKVLIESLTAQRDEANRRAALAELAKENLRLAVDAANQAAEEAEKELEQYAENTTQNHECVVDQSVIDRLRNR